VFILICLTDSLCVNNKEASQDCIEQTSRLSGAYLSQSDTNDGLIDALKANGVIRTPKVATIMRKVDRKNFARDNNKEMAYVDSPMPIGNGQTISAPHMHCEALEQLHDVIKEGSHVLDVGSGSGYLTACFATLTGQTGKVIGIERVNSLVHWAQMNLNAHDPGLLSSGRVKILEGDGWEGYPPGAPYDAIHVGAAAESIPQALIDQLKPGGKMIIPVGTKMQYLYLVKKDKDGSVHKEELMGVIYVPLIRSKKNL